MKIITVNLTEKEYTAIQKACELAERIIRTWNAPEEEAAIHVDYLPTLGPLLDAQITLGLSTCTPEERKEILGE